MRTFLPSNGQTGISSLNLRNPTIRDLRFVEELSAISEIRKTDFVASLLEDPTAINKITLDDRDYLFVLAVAVLQMNKLSFGMECCDEEIKGVIEVGNKEPKFLTDPLNCTKELFGQKYTFRKLLVEDETKAIEYALKVEKDYDSRLEDALVCRILDREITEENIKWVCELDYSVYRLAQFYQLCLAHGIELTAVVECPKCGKSIVACLPINGDLLSINMGSLMERFASLSKNLDYLSFMEMTLPEYNSFVETLNNKK